MSKHTPGPWIVVSRGMFSPKVVDANGLGICHTTYAPTGAESNARLIAAAPTQHAEMLRYLPVLERAEADSELWARLTDGLGIATLNGYRAAIKKAEEGEKT